MDTLNLGKLIDSPQQRDAIHIAVAPVVADCDLAPGEHVGFVIDGDTTRVGPNGKHIGIVDPYLVSGPTNGKGFWLFLYPNTVVSLRHHWLHPAFTDEPPQKSAQQSEAEKWLRAFATMNYAEYDELIQAAIARTEYCFGNDDGPSNARDYQFWSHLEDLTGREFSDEHREEAASKFRCAC